MAFGKTSKKTQKTKAEVPSKTKTAVGAKRTRTPKPIVESKDKDTADLAVTKSGRKSPAVVDLGSISQDTDTTPVSSDAPMAMSAAVGSSGTASLISSASAVNHSVESSVAADHAGDYSSIAHVNESSNGATREAIAERAYFYWAERGYTHGFAEEDWKRAEAELTTK